MGNLFASSKTTIPVVETVIYSVTIHDDRINIFRGEREGDRETLSSLLITKQDWDNDTVADAVLARIKTKNSTALAVFHDDEKKYFVDLQSLKILVGKRNK